MTSNYEELERGTLKSWDDWLFEHTEQRARLLELNDNFQHEVKKIRLKFGIDELVNLNNSEVTTWIQRLARSELIEWDKNITSILQRCKMMAGWRKCIEKYILTNEMIAPPSVLIHDTPDKYGIPELTLTINDFVDIRDFNKLQELITTWREFWKFTKSKRQRSYTKMDTYTEIYKLKKDGMSNKEIAEVFQKRTESSETKQIFTTKSVTEDLKRYQNLIDKQM